MKVKIIKLLIFFVLVFTTISYGVGAAQVWSFEEEHEFLISSIKDEPIVFSVDMIEKHISASEGELTGITVTALPKSSEGILVKGSELVKEYQRIPRSEISMVKFIPVYGSGSSSFTFIPESDDSIKTTIVINLIDEPNNPPISANKDFKTIKGLSITGNIDAKDPENDVITVRPVKYPTKGTITIDGTNFKYIPYDGKTGSDSFVYYLKDSYGNISTEYTINFDIEKTKQTTFLSDMSENAYHYSAIKAEQSGILSGETIGAAKLFYPDTPIKRSEFLVMLTAASGSESNLMVCVNTGLSNDSSLRMWVKPYVNLNIEKGIIDNNYFGGGENLTRAEAIHMVDKAMGKEDVQSEKMFIKDIGAIPNKYLQSYINLENEDMLHLYDGSAYPNAILTRDYAADLLYSLYEYKSK